MIRVERVDLRGRINKIIARIEDLESYFMSLRYYDVCEYLNKAREKLKVASIRLLHESKKP